MITERYWKLLLENRSKRWLLLQKELGDAWGEWMDLGQIECFKITTGNVIGNWIKTEKGVATRSLMLKNNLKKSGGVFVSKVESRSVSTVD